VLVADPLVDIVVEGVVDEDGVVPRERVSLADGLAEREFDAVDVIERLRLTDTVRLVDIEEVLVQESEEEHDAE
jgi:hypothetical protein